MFTVKLARGGPDPQLSISISISEAPTQQTELPRR